ncbi:hypothetical protein CHC167_11390 [Helicobacter pylori]
MSRLKNNCVKPNGKFACIVSVMLKYKRIELKLLNKGGFYERARMGFKRFI